MYLAITSALCCILCYIIVIYYPDHWQPSMGEEKDLVISYAAYINIAFGTLTLLVGRQEGYLACKNLKCLYAGGGNLTGVRCR